MRSLKVDQAARADAIAAHDWYAAQSAAAAERFGEALEKGFYAVQEEPARWYRLAENISKYRLRRFPFSLIYAYDDHSVTILAVAHDKREPSYWQDRL